MTSEEETMKRRILICLLALCSVIGAWAQRSMQVESLRLLENDLTANHYGTSKTDATGKTSVPIKNVTSGSRSRGIAAVEQMPLAFYLGAGYTIRALNGLTAITGAVFHSHDIQLSYTFGLSKSDPVYWYDNTSGKWLSTVGYKQNSLSVHYGYQFNLMRQLAITPQVGYSFNMLSGNVSNGEGNYGDGSKASCLTLGVKLLLVPVQHLYVIVAPEYAVELSQENYYKNTSEIRNFSVGGFSVNAGLLFSF